MRITPIIPIVSLVFFGSTLLLQAQDKVSAIDMQGQKTSAIIQSETSLLSEQIQPQKTEPDKKGRQVEELSGNAEKPIRIKNKIIPISNPVYKVLDFYEAKGDLGFLPQAKPYTKIYIAGLLSQLLGNQNISEKEKAVLTRYYQDITAETNGLVAAKYSGEYSSALAGFSAETSVRAGAGDNGTWSTSLIGEPYLSGDLGKHLSFSAGMGLAVERLTPDIFYQSYTRDKKVNFPYESIGYSYLPHQFNFETMWAHVLAKGTSGEDKPVKDELTAGMIYHTELSGSWFNGAVQMSVNNLRRAWGNDENNLVLSSTARRFPAVELKLEPAPWIRYSYLTGSLFSYANQRAEYRQQIYGYDLGQVQKMFTYHLLELMPAKWMQLAAGGGNIWSKRLELAYLVPFVLPHFTQIDVGDHDNLTMNFDLAFRIPEMGKVWGSLLIDEVSFTKEGKMTQIPYNRYAWQIGWKTTSLSGLIPGTTSTIKYTKLNPFVYTHYPETDFNTFGSDRPLDMTYSHDEFNLGFYLPPNSGELTWKLENIAIKDLTLTLDNRLITHGTNDLSASNPYQIYGDLYRYYVANNSGSVENYPLKDFTKDGIYDYTLSSEFKFDWKIRNSKLINFYRVVGSVGYAQTRWETNNSGVAEPEKRSLFTGSIGIIVEM